MKKAEVDLAMAFINTHSKIQKRLGSALSAHGIGLTEFLVLYQLYAVSNRKLQRSELAEQVGLSPSGVTRLLNPMEKIGLITKESNPRDARVSFVALSKAGEQVFQDASSAFAYAAVDFFKPLGKSQLNLLLDLLKKTSR